MALTDGLVSYWKLDESSGSVLDAHGSNNGTNSGAVPNVTGKLNTCYDFEAGDTSDQISFSVTSEIINHAFSFSVWVKPESHAAPGTIFSQRQAANGSPICEIILTTDAKINFQLRNNAGGGLVQLNSSTTLTDGVWTHVIVTLDTSDGDMNIFLDNVNRGNANYSGGTWDNVDTQRIGRNSRNAEPFDGLIDEAGIWDRELISSERSDLNNSGAGLSYDDFAAAPPVAEFSASTLIINEGDTVTFTDESTESPTSWLWNFGDDVLGTSTLQNPTHDYLSQGYYTVSLTATNATGSDDETKTNYIQVDYARPATDPTGTTGTKGVSKRYPVVEGLTAKTTYQDNPPYLEETGLN